MVHAVLAVRHGQHTLPPFCPRADTLVQTSSETTSLTSLLSGSFAFISYVMNTGHQRMTTNFPIVPAVLNRRLLTKYCFFVVFQTRSIWKMLGPFATASRSTPHYHSPGVATVASHAACASMSTTKTTTTTTRDRGDRYGPMEWAQWDPVSYTHLTLPTILRV